MERDAAMLENGSDFDRELLAAFLLVAFPEAKPGLALAVLAAPGGLQPGCLPNGPAMGANRAIGPQGGF
jgi:hypothetical protein